MLLLGLDCHGTVATSPRQPSPIPVRFTCLCTAAAWTKLRKLRQLHFFIVKRLALLKPSCFSTDVFPKMQGKVKAVVCRRGGWGINRSLDLHRLFTLVYFCLGSVCKRMQALLEERTYSLQLGLLFRRDTAMQCAETFLTNLVYCKPFRVYTTSGS